MPLNSNLFSESLGQGPCGSMGFMVGCSGSRLGGINGGDYGYGQEGG